MSYESTKARACQFYIDRYDADTATVSEQQLFNDCVTKHEQGLTAVDVGIMSFCVLLVVIFAAVLGYHRPRRARRRTRWIKACKWAAIAALALTGLFLALGVL